MTAFESDVRTAIAHLRAGRADTATREQVRYHANTAHVRATVALRDHSGTAAERALASQLRNDAIALHAAL